jgi:hypothetical protein
LLLLTQQAAEQIDGLLRPVGVAAQGLAGRLPCGEIAAAAVKAMMNGNEVFFGGTVAYRPPGHDARTRLHAPYIERNGAQAGAAPTVAKLVIRTKAISVNRGPKRNEVNHE